jgi:hypothetical protein
MLLLLLEKYSLQCDWVGNGHIHVELCWQKKLGKRPLREDEIWETNFRKVNFVDVESWGEGTIWELWSGMDGVEI